MFVTTLREPVQRLLSEFLHCMSDLMAAGKTDEHTTARAQFQQKCSWTEFRNPRPSASGHDLFNNDMLARWLDHVVNASRVARLIATGSAPRNMSVADLAAWSDVPIESETGESNASRPRRNLARNITIRSGMLHAADRQVTMLAAPTSFDPAASEERKVAGAIDVLSRHFTVVGVLERLDLFYCDLCRRYGTTPRAEVLSGLVAASTSNGPTKGFRAGTRFSTPGMPHGTTHLFAVDDANQRALASLSRMDTQLYAWASARVDAVDRSTSSGACRGTSSTPEAGGTGERRGREARGRG